jgi:hypothetical protein
MATQVTWPCSIKQLPSWSSFQPQETHTGRGSPRRRTPRKAGVSPKMLVQYSGRCGVPGTPWPGMGAGQLEKAKWTLMEADAGCGQSRLENANLISIVLLGSVERVTLLECNKKGLWSLPLALGTEPLKSWISWVIRTRFVLIWWFLMGFGIASRWGFVSPLERWNLD